MRVLIDTNVLVSYLLNRSGEGAVQMVMAACFDGRHTLLVPEPLLDEFRTTVLTKPRLAKRISLADLRDLTQLLRIVGEPIPAIEKQIPALVRDSRDDYLLAYALAGRADYLITGDQDLLVLEGQIPGLHIFTPARFAEFLA